MFHFNDSKVNYSNFCGNVMNSLWFIIYQSIYIVPEQKNAMLRAVASGALLPEHLLWSLLVQLTAALRVIHAAGLACR